MRQIPTNQSFRIPRETHQYSFINYGKDAKSIFIIELNEEGNNACIQCDGVGCKHMDIKGFVFKEFKSRKKWFSPFWWYKKTCWGTNYPKMVYFSHKETKEFKEKTNWFGPEDNMPIGEERNRLIDERFKRSRIMCEERANQFSISSEYILQRIIAEIWVQTKLSFRIDDERVPSTNYGEGWWEAYIPLEKDGKHYLLTWQNCD